MDFKKQEYQNKNLADILEALNGAVSEFDHRKRGPAFRAILFTLADVFQEDRPTMYRQFGSVKSKRPEQQSGGAKITRYRDQVKARKTTTTKVRPCEGCPGSDTKSVHTGRASGQRKEQMISKTPQKTAAVTFESIDDLREKFDDNTVAMRAYAQSQDIKISAAVTKAGTMAKIIFEAITGAKEEEE